MIKNTTLAILALTQGILCADLYDTEEELENKYGSPVPANVVQGSTRDTRASHYYNSGNYIVEARVILNDNPDYSTPTMCVYELHRRVDGKALTSAEITAILTRRPERGEWQYTGNDTWRLLNVGKASYFPLSRALVQRRKH